MKFLKLTWAEIKKILLKPTFYILVGGLFVAIIISAFLFTPTPRQDYPSQISGSSLSSILTNFNSQNSGILDGRANLEKRLEEKIKYIEEFNSLSKLKELQERTANFNDYYFEGLKTAIDTGSCTVDHLSKILKASREMRDYLNNIKTSNDEIDFIIKTADYENFNSTLLNIISSLPSTYDDINALENDRNALVERCTLVYNSFSNEIRQMKEICASTQKVVLSDKFIEQIKNFKSQVDSFAESQAQEISNFVLANASNENNKDYILKLRALIDDYKASYEISMIVIDNLVDIEKLKTRTSTETAYLGFEEISLYKLNEETNFYIYQIKNEIRYSKALTGLNFNSNSGIKSNCYDFAYYLTAIASLMLTIITIYLACMSFSGEKHDGLMRMNLTKPCSRTKLYFAKIYALILINLIAHLFIGFLMLIIGVCVYGASTGSVLIAIFSSSSAFAVAPFGNFIFKIFTLFLSSSFYILLASFISILFSNPVFSVMVSFLVYIFALVTNTLLSTNAFIKFLPFIHTEFSFFFGGGIWGSLFLGNLIYSGANFWLSLCYLIGFIALIITASTQIFKRQDF